MSLVASESLPISVSERQACDVLDVCRNSVRAARRRPTVQMPPLEVCINPVPEDADQETIEKGVNFPTLPRAIEKQFNY